MDKLEPSKRVAGLPRTSVKELSIFDQAMADQRKRRGEHQSRLLSVAHQWKKIPSEQAAWLIHS